MISQGEVEFEGESYLTVLMSLFYKGNPIKTHSFLDVATWQNHWKQATESASSSLSGLHFGHYHSQAIDLFLSDIKFSVINLAIRN